MLALLKRGFGLVGVVFAIVFGISRFDNRFAPPDPNVVRMSVAAKFDKLDYLIVGPSYVYNAIDTRAFDRLTLRSYDLAVATAGPYYYELMINDYLGQTKVVPRTILLNISLITFCEESDNWINYPIYRYLHGPISNEDLFCRGYISMPEYVKITRASFKTGFAKLAGLDGKPGTGLEAVRLETERFKGFVPKDEVYSDAILRRNIAVYEQCLACEFLEKKEAQLFKVIEECQSRGIKVIINEIPTFMLENFFNDIYKVRYKRLRSIIIDRHINFIENNLLLDRSCFSSPDHMNTKGAEIYTAYLINRLGVSKKYQN